MLRVCCTAPELLWHHHLLQSSWSEHAWRMLSEHQQAQHSRKASVRVYVYACEHGYLCKTQKLFSYFYLFIY